MNALRAITRLQRICIKKCTFSQRKYIGNLNLSRLLSTEETPIKILGIETSCDDTGCAVVDNHGNILGEEVNSQMLIHLKNGGVIPPLAQDLHRTCIESVVENTLNKANIAGDDLDAIAVTVKPGLALSLMIGLKYAKHLAKRYSKPIIPIHHMEAHALTIRMENDVQFPFLCLLISGGHCILTLINSISDFKLLGQTMDSAPGEAFDKTARRVKLHNIEEFSKMSGGRAIEMAALQSTNPERFEFPLPIPRHRTCSFSMSGIKSASFSHILSMERLHDIQGNMVIPEVFDLCAGFQICIARHLCHRTQRAMEYIDLNNLIPDDSRTLVISGGVACNNFIFKSLELLGEEMGYKVLRPQPKLCTDNGVMIAWNGVEKWKQKVDITLNYKDLDVIAKYPLGEDISLDVEKRQIRCSPKPALRKLYSLV